MHFEGGKLEIDMGASCGVGFEASFSIDMGAIANKIKAGFEKEYAAKMETVRQKRMEYLGNQDDTPECCKVHVYPDGIVIHGAP